MINVYYLNDHCRELQPSNVRDYVRSQAIALPPDDSKTAYYALGFFAAIALIALPFAGLPLHLFHMPTAIDLAVGASIIALLSAYLAHAGVAFQKELIYDPRIEAFKDGKLEISDLTFQEFQYYLSTIPTADEEFFRQIQVELQQGLPPKQYGDSLPESYSTGFEADFTEKSSISHLGFKEPPKGRIGVINGMTLNYSASYRRALYLSYLSGGYNVHMTHNATHGFCVDLLECFLGYIGVVTDPVWHLHHMWDQFFDDPNTGDDEIFLQVCHSQGGIHVTNALHHYPEERRKRIRVVAIAPGGYVPQDISTEAYHYVSWDPIPYIDGEGQSKAKNVLYCEPSSIDNHDFRSDIYFEPLKKHLTEFLEGR